MLARRVTPVRVLCVDESPAALASLDTLLSSRRLGWSVEAVVGAEEALFRLAAGHFDVVISELRLPGMGGAELLEKVRALSPSTVRIVLSGYADRGAALRAVPVAHEFLSKPCSPEALQDAVERATQLRAMLDPDVLRAVVAGAAALPAAPQVYARLSELLATGEPSTAQIAALVERDVALAAKLLQIVNSAFFGRSRRIVEVHDAINVLGLSLLRGLILSIEVVSVFPVRPGSRFRVDTLERHAALVGAVACAFAHEDERAQALVAGLLHDVGRLLLAAHRPDDVELLLAAQAESGRPLHELERELLGASHAEIGASLLALWGLPYPIVAAVAHHHAPERSGAAGVDLVAAVAIADALAHGEEPSEELRSRDGAGTLIAAWQAGGLGDALATARGRATAA